MILKLFFRSNRVKSDKELLLAKLVQSNQHSRSNQQYQEVKENDSFELIESLRMIAKIQFAFNVMHLVIGLRVVS